MSQLQDNQQNFEIQEKFVQTYLIISGLLLTRIQNTAEINNLTELNNSDILSLIRVGDLGFVLFIIFILSYYIMPSLINLKDNTINRLLHFTTAIVASQGLGIQLASAITHGVINVIILTLLFGGLIACTLTSANSHRIIILSSLILVIICTLLLTDLKIASIAFFSLMILFFLYLIVKLAFKYF